MLADVPLLPMPRTSSRIPQLQPGLPQTAPTKAPVLARAAWAVTDHWFQTTFLASLESLKQNARQMHHGKQVRAGSL